MPRHCGELPCHESPIGSGRLSSDVMSAIQDGSAALQFLLFQLSSPSLRGI